MQAPVSLAFIRKDTRLRTIDGLQLAVDSGQVTGPLGQFNLSGLDQRCLEIFSLTRTFDSGVKSLLAHGGVHEPGSALTSVTRLVAAGLIHRVEAGPPLKTKNRNGMFGSPRISLEECLDSGGSDRVAFLGALYELGITGGAGTSGGPQYLRRCSRVAFDYVQENGRSTGWWHPRLEAQVLAGVDLCDIGDLKPVDGSRNGILFDRIFEIVQRLSQKRIFPVLLGGDHSVSLPAISAVAAVHPGVAVIHFDAHSDLGDPEHLPDWRKNCTHGNFMSWVSENPKVSAVHQVGVRHLLPAKPHRWPKVSITGADRLSSGTLDALMSALPSDRPYYITFDVDCLDPSLISQTGTPVPGGMSYEFARDALTRIATARRIVGMDVVELVPARDASDIQEGTLVSYLIFEALSAMYRRT